MRRSHRRVVARRRPVRWWLRRHRAVYWLFVVALAALTVHALAGAAARAEDARRRWGTARDVLVARHRLDIGDVLSADDFDVAGRPLAVLTDDAVDADAADDVTGRTVVAAIEAGEPLVRARLGPDGLRGVAALVPVGWRAVAVPVGDATVTLVVGDHVDLVAAVDAATGTTARMLAERAVVVAVDERAVTVAVPADAAPRVASAVTTGAVVPVLRSS